MDWQALLSLPSACYYIYAVLIVRFTLVCVGFGIMHICCVWVFQCIALTCATITRRQQTFRFAWFFLLCCLLASVNLRERSV